jgi:hypothetical protein
MEGSSVTESGCSSLAGLSLPLPRLPLPAASCKNEWAKGEASNGLASR